MKILDQNDLRRNAPHGGPVAPLWDDAVPARVTPTGTTTGAGRTAGAAAIRSMSCGRPSRVIRTFSTPRNSPRTWIFRVADIWYTIQLTDGPRRCVGRGRKRERAARVGTGRPGTVL